MGGGWGLKGFAFKGADGPLKGTFSPNLPRPTIFVAVAICKLSPWFHIAVPGTRVIPSSAPDPPEFRPEFIEYFVMCVLCQGSVPLMLEGVAETTSPVVYE